MKKYNHEKDFDRIEKDNAILLKLISEKLDARSAAYRAEGIHGGHVGTFMYMRAELKDALATMMFEADSEEEQVFNEIERLIKKNGGRK